MNSKYLEFLKSKQNVATDAGFEVNDLNPKLYEYEHDIVRWALKKGKSAIFAECGLGKTPMQLEFANQVCRHTGKSVLVVAPLSVAHQTIREGEKFDIHASYAPDMSTVTTPGIYTTNYDRIGNFDASAFAGVVLDESSILKDYTSATKQALTDMFKFTPYKLCCTATPSPNDYVELGNHAEFLGIMSRTEMLATYFVHDGGETQKWRLKGHAEDVFWQWMGSWAVVLNNPADLGYQMDGYNLPPLNIHEIIADGDTPVTESMTLMQRRKARKDTLEARCAAAAGLVNGSKDQWLVWCDLNAESAMLAHEIDRSIEVKGSDKPENKTGRMLAFSCGLLKCLVTKPSIAGFGMNWQQCSKMIFVGLSDSYEQYYQAVRRCWRFGQTQPVDVYIVISAREGCVKENIERKQADCGKMRQAMVEQTKEITKKELQSTYRITTPYEPTQAMRLPAWEEFKHECA